MNRDGPRSAAILLCLLDPATAERVLAAMSRSAAARISRTATQLGPVTAAERQAALEAFDRSRPRRQPAAERPPGAATAADHQTTDNSPSQAGAAPAEAAPADMLADEIADGCGAASRELGAAGGAQRLAQVLKRERPQVIAAMLSTLSPSQAGGLLAKLSEELKADVLSRIEQASPVTADVRQLLARQWETAARRCAAEDARRQAGRSAVAAILRSSADDGGRAAPSGPAPSDPAEHDRDGRGGELCGQRACRLAFADLRQLDDAALRLLVHAAPARTLRVAVMDADPQFAARVTSLLPRRSRPMGPLLLADIERAQHQLALLASQLIDQGVFVLAAGSRIAAAA